MKDEQFENVIIDFDAQRENEKVHRLIGCPKREKTDD
jgi:hypothetical protein